MEKAPKDPEWISSADAARSVGMGSRWVRRHIAAGRLRATAWTAGGRVSYRIRVEDWEAFRARYGRTSEGLHSDRDAK
jgi:hypothetical protein